MSVYAFKPNPLLAALQGGRPAFGMQIYTHDPDMIEIVGYTGFDYVMICTEHSRVNPETLVSSIRAAEASGLVPLVRVTENNPALIRAAVESGAQGIVIPHVMNAAQAKQAISAMRYPPQGKCGICPAIRGSRYSQDNWEKYMAHSNKNIMFIPLLEDVEAIDNAEEILALLKPGRDCFGLGLADISNSLLTKEEERVNWQHPYLSEATTKVMAIANKMNLSMMGMAWPNADLASAKDAVARGTKLMIFFPETYFWEKICRGIMEEMQELKA